KRHQRLTSCCGTAAYRWSGAPSEDQGERGPERDPRCHGRGLGSASSRTGSWGQLTQ
ncbi:hypothetical protein ATANTOWER_015507, partial [Ataeniobius toweri]|nr:hypothetical protein [Ataeniobius toweri]